MSFESYVLAYLLTTARTTTRALSPATVAASERQLSDPVRPLGHGSLRTAKPAGARSERGRGNCGFVERASPPRRADGRVAGRGPGRRSTGRGAIDLGHSGEVHRAWLASGTTRRTALSNFRSDATDPLILLHGRPRSRAHRSGAPQRPLPLASSSPAHTTSTSQPAASSSTPPSDSEHATRRCTNTSCSSSGVST